MSDRDRLERLIGIAGMLTYYRKDQLRASQDERYHVCHSSTPYPRQELGGTQMENIVNGYCLYVPGLV